jgi:hypothetical protein
MIKTIVYITILFLLFITRPNHNELERQVKYLRSQHKFSPLYENFQHVINMNSNSIIQDSLEIKSTWLVWDFGLFTTAYQSRTAFIGILTCWIPINIDAIEKGILSEERDVFIAAWLLVASYTYHVLARERADAIFAHTPDFHRPWTFLTSCICTSTMYELFISVLNLFNVGFDIRRECNSSLLFWILFLLAPALSTIIGTAIVDQSRIGPPNGPFLGLCTLSMFGCLKMPRSRFILPGGIKVGFPGLLVFQCSMLLISQPYRSFVSLLVPIFLSAIFSALSFYIYFPRHGFWDVLKKGILPLAMQ